jgi:predicted enzyme related to lactoylglutathione lyase
MSRNYDANRDFYRAVFGYDFGDIGATGMRYSTLDLNGRPVGGIGEFTDDQPADFAAQWSTYFAVADADAAVAKVTELGGTVIAPPWDSPYGRMAIVADDQGAVFSVMSTAGEDEG